MESQATKSLPKELRALTKKRSVMIGHRQEGRAVIRINPLWDGGSKEEYTFFRHNGEQWVRIDREEAGDVAPILREDGSTLTAYGSVYETITLHPGVLGVIGGIFMGRPAFLNLVGDDLAISKLNAES